MVSGLFLCNNDSNVGFFEQLDARSFVRCLYACFSLEKLARWKTIQIKKKEREKVSSIEESYFEFSEKRKR